MVGTPAYLPGAEVGTDSALSSCCEGTQWATIIRKGFIRQSFSALLAPEGLYSVQLSIIRPSPPATASSCEILIIHRNGTLVLNQLVRNTDIQAQQSWRQIKTASFLGSSCGYTQVDTFNSSFSCEVIMVRDGSRRRCGVHGKVENQHEKAFRNSGRGGTLSVLLGGACA